MIDTSWESIRILIAMILGVVWFYLLNEHLRDSDPNDK